MNGTSSQLTAPQVESALLETQPILVSETPILDLQEPPPKPRSQKPIHAFVYSLLIVATFGLITSNYPVVVFSASFLFTLLLVIAAHEFGHLVGGWSAGLRFVSVSVGSLCLVLEKSRLRAYFKRSRLWGQANMSLVRLPNARKKLVAFVIGGPLASLSCGLGALALAPTLSPHQGELASAMYGVFAYLSLLTFLTGLFPTTIGDANPNDALLLKMLLTSRQGVKQLLASYALAMQQRNGVDSINLNRRWAKLAYTVGTKAHQLYFADWRDYQAQLQSQLSEAPRSLEKCLAASATLLPKQRDHLFAEAAYFTAKYRKNTSKAETWLKRVADLNNLHTLTLLRVKIAILSTAGNYEEALQACDRGLVFLSDVSSGTWAKNTALEWQNWRRDLERLQTAAAPGP